ncbi:MAG TPA: hypothetical protein PLK99_04125, partial [Burkholderiales bacterium]|nr:hypothetical protein [Burkholderiales bacterium]
IALRTAPELGRLVIAMPQTKSLPWLKPSRIPKGARILTDPNQSLLPPGATHAVSDTGEIRRDWGKGIFTINTARTQAALGWIGGKKLKLADVEIDLLNRNATVAVQSIDGKPIKLSGDIVVTLAGPTDIVQKMQGFYYRQPFEGTVIISARKGLRSTDPEGISYQNGHYLLRLSGARTVYRLTDPSTGKRK